MDNSRNFSWAFSLLMTLYFLSLSATTALSQSSNISTCPMDFNYIFRIPWNSSNCHNFVSQGSSSDNRNNPCCTTLLSLFGVALALHLKETSLFQLPDFSTSQSCLLDFQSKLTSLHLPKNLASSCFNPQEFVTGPNVCAGVQNISDWVAKLGPSTALDGNCRADLTHPKACDACVNAGFQVQSRLIEIDGYKSHAVSYFYFTVLYAAGVVDEAGAEGNGVLSCIDAVPSESQVRSANLLFSPDEQHFSTFTNIVRNQSIVTLLSGKNDTTKFSSMISNPSRRKSFIESSIKTANIYGFQGLDLCGYLPRTVSNATNMGILFDEWRAAVNSESRDSSEPPLILTLVVHYLPTLGSMSYQIDSLRRNLDWVHVLAYDYYVSSSVESTHAHSALYDPLSRDNTNFGIGEWICRGLLARKLVLGLVYHGYVWTLVNPKENGIGAPASCLAMTPDGSVSYKYIKLFIRSYECAPMYNATYVVSYCSLGATWIGYDNVEAIRTKVYYVKEKELLGYNVWEVSQDENWMLSLAAQDEGSKHHLLVIILLLIAVVILPVTAIMCHLWKRRQIFNIKVMMQTIRKSLPKLGSDISSANSDAPNLQVFSFTTIKVATNNFSSKNKLGEGGFGPVYKGKLPKGQEMAVKRLSKTSHQGLEEFKNEVTLTASLQHVNLVKLLGFCTQREEKMLIYEYMPNKRLDFYLFDPKGQLLLDWRKCIHIIEGITKGLIYLQEYSRLRIIHRDLKASNILLDSEMKPKIVDFGIARIFQKDKNEANTGRIVGTYGYVSPEYVKKGVYYVKSDVYSFGVLLLQIISGKKNTCFYGLDQNLNLLEYAYELRKDGKSMEFMDPSLDDTFSSCKLTRCMQVALLCVQENPGDRPSMLEVYSIIKNETAAIATPRRPAFAAKRDEVEEDDKSVSCHEIGSINVTTISQLVPR